MGATISNLATATLTMFRSVGRMIHDWCFDHVRPVNTNLPSTQRPLVLDNGIEISSTATQWGSLHVICCERGTECKLYISVYNERNIKIIYATVSQDTATSPTSLVEVFWINPRTGNPDAIKFNYPVEATAIRDLFA